MSFTASIALKDGTGQQLRADWSVTPTDRSTASGRITVQDTEVNIVHTAQLATFGTLFLVNRGTQDTLRVGWATGVYDFQLLPGEGMLLRPDGKTASIFVIGDVNDSQNLQYSMAAV